MYTVTAFTDGASRGNPGPGGYGVVLSTIGKDKQRYTKYFSQGYRLTTNNRMEIMGVCAALEALKAPAKINIYTDSQYVCNAYNSWLSGWKKRGWKTAAGKKVMNKDLWIRLENAAKPHEVKIKWVKGHAGKAQNEQADKLATDAADNKALWQVDKGFHR